MRDKAIEKVVKVLRLADNGAAGAEESKTARRLAGQIMERYGISEQEIQVAMKKVDRPTVRMGHPAQAPMVIIVVQGGMGFSWGFSGGQTTSTTTGSGWPFGWA